MICWLLSAGVANPRHFKKDKMKNSAKVSHSFQSIPSPKLPRSKFNLSKRTTTAFDSAYLIPVYAEEILPGDTITLGMSNVCRMATPLFPVMDDIYLDVHFFFVPDRITWTNFDKFHGAEDDPGDSNAYLMPSLNVSANPAIAEDTIFDYMGLPLVAATHTADTIQARWFRGYNKIYNNFYRDQNIINSVTENKGDGPDALTDYTLLKRGARHDIYTGLLPAPYKSDDGAVSLPLGTSADIAVNATEAQVSNTATANFYIKTTDDSNATLVTGGSYLATDPTDGSYPLYADLTSATAATVDEVIEAFAIQALYRTDARSGTRAFEIVQAHYGVTSPSLQHVYRPEFLGGTSQLINMNTVANTSDTATKDQGDLAAFATSSISQGVFTKSFTEWGIVLGIASVRTNRSYSQGLDRMFTRSERFDIYYPGLANLGEEAILTQEVYYQGNAGHATDITALGYQERWSHYRYGRSIMTGAMRPTHSTSLEAWHLGLEFSAAPTLNQTYIEEQGPISRVVADATAPEFIGDFAFNVKAARVMPVYSVPGMKAVL